MSYYDYLKQPNWLVEAMTNEWQDEAKKTQREINKNKK